MPSINQLARDSRPLDDTMRKLFRATTGYVITALLRKPLRGHARRIRMRSGPSGTRGRLLQNLWKKRPTRHVKYARIREALDRALTCTLNIDRSIRGKREFLSRLESACVFIIPDVLVEDGSRLRGCNYDRS